MLYRKLGRTALDVSVIGFGASPLGNVFGVVDAEAAVLLGPEQRRETGIGVEARPAQPVDRAVAADQRGALAIADQHIVLDASCHHPNSITTLMSSLRRSNASVKRTSGTRRVINRSSQARSARARLSAAIW